MANNLSTSDAKAMARRLRSALVERGNDSGHSGALELVARTLGVRDWNTLAGTAPAASATTADVVPVFRMIDWTATRRFYVEFLGGTVAWEQNAGDHTPRYAEIRLPSGVRLHLSGHNGDGTPGGTLLIRVNDLDEQLSALTATGQGATPAIDESRTGRSITVHDPVGNRIVFVSSLIPGRVSDEVPPIVNEVTLPMPPQAAFELFTSFGWWRRYGLAEGGHVSIDDGEVVFHNPDGEFPTNRARVHFGTDLECVDPVGANLLTRPIFGQLRRATTRVKPKVRPSSERSISASSPGVPLT